VGNLVVAASLERAMPHLQEGGALDDLDATHTREGAARCYDGFLEFAHGER
jgi:hypothetical protein